MGKLGWISMGIAAWCAGFYSPAIGVAQYGSTASVEFVTSSSPLPNGTVVTTTYYPQSGAAPITSLTAGYGVPLVASLPASNLPTPQSVVQNAAPPVMSTDSLRPSTSATSASVGSGWPTANQSTAVRMPTWGNPFTGPQPYWANPGTVQVGRYPYPQALANTLPSGTVYPYPVASTVPSLNAIPNLPPPPVPYTAQRPTYQPVVQFQNLPPGTYLGQGWVGQPKAYVDGQPVRNLFRYIFP